jgi:hypothetical protein
VDLEGIDRCSDDMSDLIATLDSGDLEDAVDSRGRKVGLSRFLRCWNGLGGDSLGLVCSDAFFWLIVTVVPPMVWVS